MYEICGKPKGKCVKTYYIYASLEGLWDRRVMWGFSIYK